MSLVLSPEDALQFIACHRVTFPFTPVLYFPIYNAEEKLLWEVNQNFLGVSEQKKNLKYLWKVFVLTAQSIGFGSSEPRQISSNEEAVREEANSRGDKKHPKEDVLWCRPWYD